MKLWQKVAILNIALIMTMSILSALVIREIIISAMRTEALIQGESIAINLSDRIAEAILYEDYYSVSEAISEVISKEKNIRYIFVLDLKGRPFAHTFTGGYPADLLSWNPIKDEQTRSVQMLKSEDGNITDIAVRIFAAMPSELHVGIKEDRMADTLNRLRNYMFLLTASVILAGSILSFFLSRLITRPLEQLNEFANDLSKGNFGGEMVITSKDEVGRLTETFNNLSRELLRYRERTEETYRQMLKTEKLTAIGRLSGGLAHEIKNPLMPIKTLFQTFRNNPQLTRQDIEIVLSSVQQIDEVVSKFLGFARSDHLNFTDIFINAIIKDILKVLDYQIKEQGIKVNMKLLKIPPISGDRPMLKQALFNIILNAIEAMPEGGVLEIATSTEDGPETKRIVIIISDTGSGIPQEIGDKIFDPFFTTKPEGTGLGLSLAFNIIQMHMGELAYASIQGMTTFTIKLASGDKRT